MAVKSFVTYGPGCKDLAGTNSLTYYEPENTKGGSITVPLTSCLTCMTTDNLCLYLQNRLIQTKQEVNSTVKLPSLVFPVRSFVNYGRKKFYRIFAH